VQPGTLIGGIVACAGMISAGLYDLNWDEVLIIPLDHPHVELDAFTAQRRSTDREASNAKLRWARKNIAGQNVGKMWIEKGRGRQILSSESVSTRPPLRGAIHACR